MFDFRRPYKRTETVNSSLDTEFEEEHESFGMVSIGRIQGGRHLFGSSIEQHGTFFRLSITQASVKHSLSRDWYHGNLKTLIEIDLSPAQFAEMITSLNMGGGVPCTINSILHERMEDPPPGERTEAEKIQKTFRLKMKTLVGFLKEKVETTRTLLDKKTLSKDDKKEIIWAVEKALQEIQSNAPFVLESFQEASEKVSATVKAEIEAFMALSLHKLGVESLQNRLGSGPSVPALPGIVAPDEEEG